MPLITYRHRHDGCRTIVAVGPDGWPDVSKWWRVRKRMVDTLERPAYGSMRCAWCPDCSTWLYLSRHTLQEVYAGVDVLTLDQALPAHSHRRRA